MNETKFKEYVQLLLTEAVRINNGKEAYELIKNNKLGVKLDPSYKTADESIVSILDKVINDVGTNNAPFAIQLLANKVPINNLKNVSNSDTLRKIISYRNRPWAKEIPEYKNIIDFSSKEKYNSEKWENVKRKLEQESQMHGHGDNKDVKNLYNDGTWTLQIPLSIKGEKVIAFYGKRGERQIPTEWCTRADIFWYNKYTKNSPLYVIRNWKTGKSYQIAFDKNNVHFLDQNDVKGDEITKGDLSAIPDKLLEFIKWNGKSLKDFKDSEKKSSKGKVIKGSSFRDPTNKIEDARWGKNIRVHNYVMKNVWENYADLENDKLSSYMIKGKEASYVKHDGWWAAKYWFRSDPDFFILMSRMKGSEGFDTNYFWDGDEGIMELDSDDFEENIPEADELLKIARRDIGQERKEIKEKHKRDNHVGLSNAFEKAAKEEFNNIVTNNLSKLANKYLKGLKFKLDYFLINKYVGGFLPYQLKFKLINNGKDITDINIEKPDGLKFDSSKIHYNYTDLNRILEDETNDFLKEMLTELNKSMMQYYKKIMKNKIGGNMRNNAKIVDIRRNKIDKTNPLKRIYYENYFPY